MTREVVCCRPLTPSQRGKHDIDDELVFSNHTGYIFHDSRGIESGATEELEILRAFIQCRASASQLQSRLHAIWFGLLCVNDDGWSFIFRYCIPMDNRRPALELKHFKDIYQRSHENSESSWALVTVCNASLKFPSSPYSRNMTNS